MVPGAAGSLIHLYLRDTEEFQAHAVAGPLRISCQEAQWQIFALLSSSYTGPPSLPLSHSLFLPFLFSIIFPLMRFLHVLVLSFTSFVLH